MIKLVIYTVIRNQCVTNIVLQNFERKASVKLQSCLIQKSNLRVLEKIGQGNFLEQQFKSLSYIYRQA